jgi:glycosyltransferase involved in cell wall biosynthesis
MTVRPSDSQLDASWPGQLTALAAGRPLRIAIIAPPWLPVPPPAYGGSEAVLDVLARGLQQAGHEVLLYATGDSVCPVPRSWSYERAVGVGLGGAAAELRQVIEAYEVVAESDIVHDHTLVGPVWAERFPWLPVVTTNHGPFRSELGALYRAIAGRVPVIAISAHQAADAGDIPVAAVIPHGVDLEDFPLGPGDGGYVAFLGRMHPDKGVHTAARVARAAGVPLRIAAKMHEAHERAYFEAEVAPLLGGSIEYVGEVGGVDKAALLGHAACLLNPIAWPEPFGMVMIEALAYGTPVVATPFGAVPEIVEDGVTGFLGTDEDQLVAALGKVGDLDRGACRASVQARFSAERMVADHVGFYRRVLASFEHLETPHPSPLGSARMDVAAANVGDHARRRASDTAARR